MAKTVTISKEVQAILAQCAITEERVYLPQEQLPRPLYVAVDKVLKAAGGKWNRSLQCHVFSRNPRPILVPGLETGTVTHVQQTLQAFYTPPEVAAQVIALAHLTPKSRVLEPSAGMGSLALEAAKIVPKEQITCIDTDELACETLLSLGFIHISRWDFLDCIVFPSGSTYFDAIVMNPPFANGQDLAHITHAHQFLRPSGRLVSVVAAMTGKKNRSKADKAFNLFLDQHMIDRIELPGGSFKASGTSVATSIIVLRTF